MKIGDLVKDGQIAKFVCYRDGDLWYRTSGPNAYQFEFPVPISDTGTGIFNNEMKAITLMRWIRQYLAKQEKWASEREPAK